jgi:hypothetical protein
MFGLDLVAFLTCATSAFALVVLFLVTGPHSGLFLLPWWVRAGFLGTAGSFVYRAVDLVSLYQNPERALGHADVLAVIAGVGLSYSLGTLALCLYTRTLARRRNARIAGHTALPLPF